MMSRIKIKEKNKEVVMIIERKKDTVWKVVRTTTDEEIISEFLHTVQNNIASYSRNHSTLNVELKNGANITVSNYPELSQKEVLKPLKRAIRFYETDKKKRKKRIIFSATLLSLMAVGEITYVVKRHNSKKEEKKIQLEDETNHPTIEEEPKNNPVIDDSYEIVQLSNDLYEEEPEEIIEISYHDFLPDFGTQAFDDKYNHVHENYGDIVEKYATISGIDASIIECVLAQERAVHSTEVDIGGAIGVAQIQYNQHLDSELTLHNVITNEDETFKVTMDLLKDLDGNIKTCVTLLQNHLERYNGNIFLALQAYNYGPTALNRVINLAEEKSSYNEEMIKGNVYNLFWIPSVKEYSNNKGGYGDSEYLNHVFSRYPDSELTVCYGEVPVIVTVKEQKQEIQFAQK